MMSIEEIYNQIYQPLMQVIQTKDYKKLLETNHDCTDGKQHEVCSKMWHEHFSPKVYHGNNTNNPDCYVLFIYLLIMSTHFRIFVCLPYIYIYIKGLIKIKSL